MTNYKKFSYTDKIRFRIRGLWGTLILLLVYMVVVGEMGLGDSRVMTPLAEKTSDLIFFGGIGYVIYQIVHNKKLLKNRSLLLENLKKESEERQQFLHEKSGGIVITILLFLLLFITCTSALISMPAFHASATILLITILLKAGSFLIFSKIC